MTDSQRNMLILLAVAVAGVLFSGAFGVAAGGAQTFLQIAFMVVIVWLIVTLYQRHSGTIATMPIAPRVVLHAAMFVLLALVITGSALPFLPWPFGWSSVYPQIYWPLLIASGFAIWWSWQNRTTGW